MVDHEVLVEKDHTINQMRETIEILELKIKKLEQLVKLKDSKIANLGGKLQSMGPRCLDPRLQHPQVWWSLGMDLDLQ